jgi:hypothetical protein
MTLAGRRSCSDAKGEEVGEAGPPDVISPHRADTNALDSGPSRPDEVVAVPGCNGVLVLPGWLTPQEQLALAHRCLAVYPEPPNKTNLIPHIGQVHQPSVFPTRRSDNPLAQSALSSGYAHRTKFEERAGARHLGKRRQGAR